MILVDYIHIVDKDEYIIFADHITEVDRDVQITFIDHIIWFQITVVDQNM